VYVIVVAAICLFAVVIVGWYSMQVLRRRGRDLDDIFVLLCVKLGVVNPSGDDVAYETLKSQAQTLAQRLSTRLKIYVNLWQIGSLLPLALDLQFPELYGLAISALRVLDLSISRAALIDCSSSGYDAIDALLVDTISPLLIVLLLWIMSVVHVWFVSSAAGQSREKTIRSLRSKYFVAVRIFTYLILPGRSAQIFSVFSCKNVDPDEVNEGDDSYMVVDYSVSCSSSKYEFGRSWAIAMMLVYPIGIPLFYFCLLFRARLDIQSRNDPSLTVEQSALLSQRIDPISSLFHSYKPHLWYWELVETISRLLLTGVLVLIAQGSAIQIVIGAVFSIASLLIHNYSEPYIDANLQLAKHISYWQIYGLFFIALLLKSDFESMRRNALGVVLLLLLICGVVNDLCRFIWHHTLIKRRTSPLKSHQLSCTNPSRLTVALSYGADGDIRLSEGSLDPGEQAGSKQCAEEEGCGGIGMSSPLHDERL
jgi:hypothetical protein